MPSHAVARRLPQIDEPRDHGRPPRPRWLRRVALVVVSALVVVVGSLAAYALVVVEPQITPVSAAARARIEGLVVAHHGEYLPLDRMGTWLPRATMAVEDRRFYGHGPVDPVAALRALLFDVRGGHPVQGGATIDEQLAERLLGRDSSNLVTYAMRVILLANRLDHDYGKSGVLDLYLNDIYYGRGAYGADAAARDFYGVTPAELTPAQASFLAGLPNWPAVYGNHPDAAPAEARWHVVLRSMVRAGQLSAADAQRLMQEGPPPMRSN